MPETQKRVYTGRGITRKLKAYIPETDNMMILSETSVCEAVVNRICHQFPQAAVYMAVTSQHMNTFDAMEAIVHFLYHKGFRKHSSMLIVGGQQLKALGGFTASSYYCGIDYMYIPVSEQLTQHDRADICGIDLLGITDVLQAAYAPCAVFQDEEIFELMNAESYNF